VNYEEYESLVAEIFRQLKGYGRYRVETQKKRPGASGQPYTFDVWAERADGLGLHHRVGIECKNWNAKVGVDIVQQFRSVLQDTATHKGIIVSREGFQSGAIKVATSAGVSLIRCSQAGEIDVVVRRMRGRGASPDSRGPLRFALVDSETEKPVLLPTVVDKLLTRAD